MKRLIKNGIIVNEGSSSLGSILIEGERIGKIILSEKYDNMESYNKYIE